MDVTRVVLAPFRLPVRLIGALDDLAAIAERARRDPDPVDELRERVDLALAELVELIGTARAILGTMQELQAVANSVIRIGIALDSTGRDLHDGGEDLVAVSKAIEVDSRQLMAGGERLEAVSERMEAHLQVVRRALPRILEGLDSVEQLEESAETMAETVEPLQGAAETVGRVADRFSRRKG